MPHAVCRAHHQELTGSFAGDSHQHTRVAKPHGFAAWRRVEIDELPRVRCIELNGAGPRMAVDNARRTSNHATVGKRPHRSGQQLQTSIRVDFAGTGKSASVGRIKGNQRLDEPCW